ncbi:MAG: polyisoprenoid-binding protein [Proteobacteria bacterium]|nr:polyisoprenoid-binding protein [Pseudomonadota bacterium]
MSHAVTACVRTSLFAAALVFAQGAIAAAVPYAIDPNHTQIQYTYTHMGFSHISGRLSGVEGDFLFDAQDPTRSQIQIHVPVSSISVGVPALDEELHSEMFFDVAKYPLATFKSTTVTRTDKDHLAVSGELTIHGVTKPATFEVTINKIGTHPMRGVPAVGVDATTTIKRSDFGVSKFVPGVSDEVVIHATMEAYAPKAK